MFARLNRSDTALRLRLLCDFIVAQILSVHDLLHVGALKRLLVLLLRAWAAHTLHRVVCEGLWDFDEA